MFSLWIDRNKEDLRDVKREIEMLQSDIQIETLRAKDFEEKNNRRNEAIRQAEIEKVWNHPMILIIILCLLINIFSCFT